MRASPGVALEALLLPLHSEGLFQGYCGSQSKSKRAQVSSEPAATMKPKRKRSFWKTTSGNGFGASCAKAGQLAVLGRREEALSVIKATLGRHRGRAQQYQLLCQGGGCLFGLGRYGEALRVFQEALEAAYEPAGAVARMGIAKCKIATGDPRGAREEVSNSIREASKAARTGYTRDGEGTWTLSAIPLYAQGIAMKIYPTFDKFGKGEIGMEILRETLRVGGGSGYRLKLLLAKLAERKGDRRGALRAYEEAMSPAVLGPRGLSALAGWGRCTQTRDAGVAKQKLSGFRGRLMDRAVLTAATNLRLKGRGVWKNVVEVDLPKQDKPAAVAALQLRVLMLSNRGRWDEMNASAEELLSIPGLTTQEAAGAVAAAGEALWHLGQGGAERLASKASNKNDARWALHKRLLDLGEGEGAEAFFKSRAGGGGAALFNLGRALALQDKFQESQDVFRKICSREHANPKIGNAALVALLSPLSTALEVPEDGGELLRRRVNKLAEGGGASSIFGLAGLATKLGRIPGRRALAKVPLEEARDIFPSVFFSTTSPRQAVALLNSMNEALEAYGGRGGIRDLYLTTAEGCLPMLKSGGDGYFRYITSVYEATYSSGLVVEAGNFWKEATKEIAVPDKWRAAKMVEEGTRRIYNRQHRGMSLVRSAYFLFGTGPFAAKACYFLSLDELGKGDFRQARPWAQAGLDSLGSEITAGKSAWLRARLEVVAAGLNGRTVGKRWRKWKGLYRWKGTLERVMRDLSIAEAPTSA